MEYEKLKFNFSQAIIMVEVVFLFETTVPGPEAEALKEIREKLGDGKMSGVYHCLEVGMR